MVEPRGDLHPPLFFNFMKHIRNYIPLNRNIFNHFFWTESRVFSDFEAWLDIIRSASFKDNQKKLINKRLAVWDRGEWPVSISFLCERWVWKPGKVRGYLKLLEKEEMIEVLKRDSITYLKVSNYEDYNFEEQTENIPQSIPIENLFEKMINSNILHNIPEAQQRAYLTDILLGRNGGREQTENIPLSNLRTGREHTENTPRTNREQQSNNLINNNNEKKSVAPSVPDGPARDIEFMEVMKFIARSKKLILIPQQLTHEEFKKLRDNYEQVQIMTELESMENWKGLNKKQSIYLTALNWLKRDYGDNTVLNFEEDFLKIYAGFIEKETESKPKITADEKRALHRIIKHLVDNTADPVKSWQYIFKNWKFLDKFYKKRIRLFEIDQDLINIMRDIKNKVKSKSKTDIDEISHE